MNRDVVRQAAVVLGALIGIGLGLTGDYGSGESSPSPVAAASYTFFVWALIYAGILTFAVNQALPSRRTDRVLRRAGWPAAAAFFAIGLWADVFLLERYWLTEALVLVTLAVALLACARVRPAVAPLRRRDCWLVRAPLFLLGGWLTVATVVGSTEALLTEGFAYFGLGATLYGVLLLLLAGAAATAVTLLLRGSLAYPWAVAWGLVGIVVTQLGDRPAVALTAVAMALLLVAAGAWTVAGGPGRGSPRGVRGNSGAATI